MNLQAFVVVYSSKTSSESIALGVDSAMLACISSL
jgi:hypothetical protein